MKKSEVKGLITKKQQSNSNIHQTLKQYEKAIIHTVIINFNKLHK
jgi:hypothetical protein